MEPYRQEAIRGLSRLAARGFAGDFQARLSVRLPGGREMLAGSIGPGGAPAGVALVPLDSDCHDRQWALDRTIYRFRADVGAVVTARMPWTARLASLPDEIPALFDEQVWHLGPRVERISLDDRGLTAADSGLVLRGGNAFILAGQAICLGFHQDRAVCNAELLEKCAEAYVLATLSGLPIRRLPLWVRHIAWRRLRSEEKRLGSGAVSRLDQVS